MCWVPGSLACCLVGELFSGRCKKGPGKHACGAGADFETICGLLLTLCTSLCPRVPGSERDRMETHRSSCLARLCNPKSQGHSLMNSAADTAHRGDEGGGPLLVGPVASLAMEGMPVFGSHGVGPSASASVPSTGTAVVQTAGNICPEAWSAVAAAGGVLCAHIASAS